MTGAAVTGNDFPFLSVRTIEAGPCPETIALRLSFTGELGYELYCPAEYQRGLHAALVEAGRDLGLAPAGSRALMSLRLEKGFPGWGLELSADYGPDEPGLGRFVRLDKADFIGRDAVIRQRADGPRQRLASFTSRPARSIASAARRSSATARSPATSPRAATATASAPAWRWAMSAASTTVPTPSSPSRSWASAAPPGCSRGRSFDPAGTRMRS